MTGLKALASLSFTALCTTFFILPVAHTKNKTVGANKPPAGQAERVIKRVKYSNEPIELTDVQIDGQSLKGKEAVTISRSMADWRELKFTGADDWPKNVQLTFKNVAGKPIVAMGISFFVSHPDVKHRIELPLIPTRFLPHHLKKGMPDTKALQPNEEITYVIRQSDLERVTEMLKEAGGTPRISTVEMRIDRIQFDYDNGWNDGRLYRRNPMNPDNWIVVIEGARKESSPSKWRAIAFGSDTFFPQGDRKSGAPRFLNRAII